jgi:hypothetical protein
MVLNEFELLSERWRDPNRVLWYSWKIVIQSSSRLII